MRQNDPRCDVHMYQNKPNAKKLFLWLQFLGGVGCFHLSLPNYYIFQGKQF
jgi:hypothetical protein